MARDYYEVLGVPRDADKDQIQQAYRKLARRYHPDVNSDPAAVERFKQIGEAYQVLADPETRRRYDRFGENFRQIPEDYDERMAGAGGFGTGGVQWGPGTGGIRVNVGQGFGHGGEAFDFDDLFGGIFGGRGGFSRSGFGGGGGYGPMAGTDQEAELVLTFEEAYRGGRRSLGIDGSTLTVDIPPGVTDGQRIRLAGQGGRGSGGAAAGDLYLIVRIQPHPRYRLDGRDIYLDLPVSPWEAVLGATVAVSTPGGEAKVRVVPGSSTGRKLRLRGEGMPNPRGANGDLYAEIKVVVPDQPTERERQLFEQLAAVSSFDPRRAR
ncbi:DnaJ C-terminal domain-containing protein [Nocardia brasiliensis]|uniref:DnaJ C-terminal domain-containing protein n=1 Tax=Nocardia brasiliensis TaxID=37326 RepID=UPI0036714B37